MKNLDVTYVLGNTDVLAGVCEQKPMAVFAEETLEFLDALSKEIRKQPELHAYPDMAAFAFWCRKSNMIQEGAVYGSAIGKGVALHFVPSNIPLLFMYSLSAALLAGNSVIMRLPSKDSVQEGIVIRCMERVMAQMSVWKERIVLLRYGHDKNVTDTLSKMCDVRVVWGGDASVAEICKSETKDGVEDLAFVDRKSAAVFDAQAILDCADMRGLVHNFYNDTYLNDQNACSSPSVICWLGDNNVVEKAKARFWESVDALVKERYVLPANAAVKKWEMALKTAALQEDIHIIRHDNRVICIESNNLWINWWLSTMYCGYFIEYCGKDVRSIAPLAVKKCQTLTCFGVDVEMVKDFIKDGGFEGVDRVVGVGHALDFELIWDGIDLIKKMSE